MLMKSFSNRWRAGAQTPPRTLRRAMRPSLEGLEKRELLYSTTGGLWSQPQRVTFSFAPDGTSVGGTPSAWFQTMAARGISQTTWQNQFRQAAAIWEAVTNINLVEVPDNGTAFNASGN